MTAPGRWIRLNIDWSDTGWLYRLPPESRLCWIELLCHVKANGFAGRVKSLDPDVAADKWKVTRYAVTEMLDAAIEDGSLLLDGSDWVIPKWRKYQGDETNSKRQKEYRERNKVTRYGRDVTDVTPTVTETVDKNKNIDQESQLALDDKPKKAKTRKGGEPSEAQEAFLESLTVDKGISIPQAIQAMNMRPPKNGNRLSLGQVSKIITHLKALPDKTSPVQDELSHIPDLDKQGGSN